MRTIRGYHAAPKLAEAPPQEQHIGQMKLVLLDCSEPIPLEWIDLAASTLEKAFRKGAYGQPFEAEACPEYPRFFDGLRSVELKSSGSTVRIEGVESVLVRGRMSTSHRRLSFKLAVMDDSPATLRPIFVPAVSPEEDPFAAILFSAN
jgi:hypothetical protein